MPVSVERFLCLTSMESSRQKTAPMQKATQGCGADVCRGIIDELTQYRSLVGYSSSANADQIAVIPPSRRLKFGKGAESSGASIGDRYTRH